MGGEGAYFGRNFASAKGMPYDQKELFYVVFKGKPLNEGTLRYETKYDRRR